MSGPCALEITRLLVGNHHFTPEANRTSLRTLRDPDHTEVLDQALITYFKSPHSFTGEDVIELSCHGSPVILRRLIDVILRLNARMADAGEFTLRALANGRLNLSQAEAVRDLINAQTDAAARQAARQLGGELSLRVQPFKEKLLEIIVPLESSLEFVEDDLPEITANQFSEDLLGLIESIKNLCSTYRSGHLLRDGLKVAIIGRPNVGKSSIFNCLVAFDRSIVSPIPGTTRDSLSELINIGGIPTLLIDTAGIHQSSDEIENMGVVRARRAMVDADLNVVVLDISQPSTAEDQSILKEVASLPHLITLNKSDLVSRNRPDEARFWSNQNEKIYVSAKTGDGLDKLRNAIINPFTTHEIHDSSLLITNARHYDLLWRTQSALSSSINLLKQRASEETVLVELYNALHLLGEVTGETTPVDVLNQIFATFCIGK